MLGDPYIRHGTIFFVPVIRQRLSFAMLARRTAKAIQLGPNDAIAVSLPPSVEPELRRCVSMLPLLQRIVMPSSDSPDREIFIVTPVDAMVDAFRIAATDIPICCIDQELDPAHLKHRTCRTEVNWPDDALALTYGVSWYMELIKEHLCRPPVRWEPLDTWRELHIARELRKLAPKFRQVLAIVEAQHLHSIQSLLTNPVDIEHQTFTPLAPVAVQKPAQALLLSYLDDLPHLAQLFFESTRVPSSSVEEFDRRRAILQLVQKLAHEGQDLTFSLRSFSAFSNFLDNLMHTGCYGAAPFEAVVLACAACFNLPFAHRVRRQLLTYFQYVRSDADVEPTINDIQQSFEKDVLGQNRSHFVSRMCNPQRRSYIVTRRNLARRSGYPGWAVTWPGWVWHVAHMLEKARRLARMRTFEIRSSEFSGSLRQGIDVRRTLKSHFRGAPRLWVQHKRFKRGLEVDLDAPVIWIFSHPDQSESPPQFNEEFDAVKTGPTYSYAYRFDQKKVTTQSPAGMNVFYWTAMGLAVFADMRLDRKSLLNHFGSKIEERVPRFAGNALNVGFQGGTWADQLLRASLRFAVKSVICVCPDGWVIPRNVVMDAHSAGKRLHRISLTRFTAEEIRRLRTTYCIDGFAMPVPDDSYDHSFNKKVFEFYNDEMRNYW